MIQPSQCVRGCVNIYIGRHCFYPMAFPCPLFWFWVCTLNLGMTMSSCYCPHWGNSFGYVKNQNAFHCPHWSVLQLFWLSNVHFGKLMSWTFEQHRYLRWEVSKGIAGVRECDKRLPWKRQHVDFNPPPPPQPPHTPPPPPPTPPPHPLPPRGFNGDTPILMRVDVKTFRMLRPFCVVRHTLLDICLSIRLKTSFAQVGLIIIKLVIWSYTQHWNPPRTRWTKILCCFCSIAVGVFVFPREKAFLLQNGINFGIS